MFITKYIKDVFSAVRSVLIGMRRTGYYFTHHKEIITQEYPDNRETLHLPERFWARLSLLPLWALLQQYVMLGFIYRRLRQLLRDYQTILITAGLFALVHAPNISLMILTFLGGLIWSFVYERAPNLFAPALSHMLLSATVLVTLPESILPSMTVGYHYLLFHNF